MGILDAFSPEDRISVKFSDFYTLMLESSRAELMMNAVKCNVPHRYIRETMTGKSEAPPPPLPEPVQDEGEAGHDGT